ncbi:class E sortase [Streptomyces stelliscabiei]|uniref:class E sortase n=1 Tax=Streptomyces stelliscabiei TaxID=146820 RepID=UPI0029ABE649|nr:class E sortase [Streptomyces stelliscabiei]MDX2556862.1 class E sortase [Streptomyces stelliscabiei]MDX2615751.1 class E sortase [Streptomyces stelliscabiei]MDX2640607.1 class E sortase [Streptomyces stelliscabiei]MDX2667516.1 class E sortase [Streptomyces stelliscabiei]MDX2718099.1 class E sortase [Streptomyces stelliscabiei]
MKVAHPRALQVAAEAAVTLGLVLLLLLAHQLWWTNRQAQESAAREVAALEREWGADTEGSGEREERRGEREHPARAYAVLAIPRLHLRVPVAEGVGRADVLDSGYVGHYPGTAQPGRPGNLALAGHRNTHGEPFRHLDRLAPGDEVHIETRDTVHTYVVDRTLPQTAPGDRGVLRPVPRSDVRPSYGYAERGHYLTLTTCTPAYTSTYRLVVWGKLRSVRLR